MNLEGDKMSTSSDGWSIEMEDFINFVKKENGGNKW
jgi:hypothetical protein